MKPRAIITLVAGLISLILVLQNLGGSTVGLLFWDVTMPLSILLVAFYVVGGFTARPLGRLLKKVWYQKD